MKENAQQKFKQQPNNQDVIANGHEERKAINGIDQTEGHEQGPGFGVLAEIGESERVVTNGSYELQEGIDYSGAEEKNNAKENELYLANDIRRDNKILQSLFMRVNFGTLRDNYLNSICCIHLLAKLHMFLFASDETKEVIDAIEDCPKKSNGLITVYEKIYDCNKSTSWMAGKGRLFDIFSKNSNMGKVFNKDDGVKNTVLPDVDEVFSR